MLPAELNFPQQKQKIENLGQSKETRNILR